MEWILIAAIYGYREPSAVVTRLPSKATCEEAGNTLVEMNKKTRNYVRISWSCIEVKP